MSDALSTEQFIEKFQQLDPAEQMSVTLLIAGLHNHPEGWKPPIDNLSDLSLVDIHVLRTLRLLVLHPNHNRNARGQFRKKPTRDQICFECLTLLKGAHDFEGDADQAAIARWLDVLGNVEGIA